MKSIKKLIAILMTAAITLTSPSLVTGTTAAAASTQTTVAAVTGLKATTSTSAVKLTWKKNAKAAGYYIKQYNTKFGEWQTIAKITKNATVTYTIKNLKAKTKYKFQVVAYKGSVKSKAASITAATKAKTTTIAAITGLKATASASAVKLTWKKNAKAAGYYIKQYNTKFGEWQTVGKLTKNTTVTYTVKNLKAKTKYKFQVVAYKGSAKSKAASVTVTTKAAAVKVGKVTNFTATNIKSSSATLKWDKDKTAKGYKVYQKSGSSWKLIKTISKNTTTTLAVSKLKAGTDYDFKIVSFNGSKTGGAVACCVKTAVDSKYIDVDCTYCENGVCSHCNGTGKGSGYYGCAYCDKNTLYDGDGKCFMCHGKGTQEKYVAGKAGSATVGNKYTAPSGNTGGSGGSGDTGLITPAKTRHTCTTCGGDGRVSYIDWSDNTTKYVKCQVCDGKGYYYS